MKSADLQEKLLLLLAGFFLLAIPASFFAGLAQKSLERNRQTAFGLMRERLLNEAERVTEQLKPANYVRSVIRKIHQDILPTVTPEQINMLPDVNFGEKEFSRSLLADFVNSLNSRGLKPLYLIVCSPGLKNSYYFSSAELLEQCDAPESLTRAMTRKTYNLCTRIYRQNFKQDWGSMLERWQTLLKYSEADSENIEFRYLSRFSIIVPQQDFVQSVFTDYYGQQLLFYYTCCSISRRNIHGAYSIMIPQTSIDTKEIIRTAIAETSYDLDAQLVTTAADKSGFEENSQSLCYLLTLPTEFWNHYFFASRITKQKVSNNIEKYRIKLKLDLPVALRRQQQLVMYSGLLLKLGLMVYALFACRYLLTGAAIKMSLRKKTAIIMAIVILLPVFAASLLIASAAHSFARIIDSQMQQQTINVLKEADRINEENHLRFMLAAIETKKYLQELDNPNKANLFVNIFSDHQSPNWFTSATIGTSVCFSDGQVVSYTNYGGYGSSNKIWESLLNKYMQELGLQKVYKIGTSDKLEANAISISFIENYLTSEMEELNIVHECTTRHDVSHTADNSLATLIVARLKNGDYAIVSQKPNNIDDLSHRYLTALTEKQPEFFSRKTEYGHIDLAARLRKILNYDNFVWPGNALAQRSTSEIFDRAMKTRDSGHTVIRTVKGQEVRAWMFQKGISTVFAVKGENSAGNHFEVAIFIVIPALIAYGVLLVLFLTGFSGEFITIPLALLESGVEKLRQETYGITLQAFAKDEFSHITGAFNEMSIALKQKEMIKRYVSGKLLKKIEAKVGTGNQTGSEVIEATILASDIRNFTSISEKRPPAEVVEMLNSYFTLMENVIQGLGGSIDKYIGDAIQAVFDERPDLEPAPTRACKAAIEMRRQLEMLNRERKGQGLFTIENGIGLATDKVIHGSIGSAKGRKDFTVIGPATHLAAHLEGLSKQTSSKIVICMNTAARLGPQFCLKPLTEEAMELKND